MKPSPRGEIPVISRTSTGLFRYRDFESLDFKSFRIAVNDFGPFTHDDRKLAGYVRAGVRTTGVWNPRRARSSTKESFVGVRRPETVFREAGLCLTVGR